MFFVFSAQRERMCNNYQNQTNINIQVEGGKKAPILFSFVYNSYK